MSLDPAVLKRILNMKITIEGPSSWAFREIIDYMIEIIEERLPLIINELLEPYQLEASVHTGKGCEIFPGDSQCDKIIIVEIYDRELNKRVAYAGYILDRGENTLSFKLYKIIDAETLHPI